MVETKYKHCTIFLHSFIFRLHYISEENTFVYQGWSSELVLNCYSEYSCILLPQLFFFTEFSKKINRSVLFFKFEQDYHPPQNQKMEEINKYKHKIQVSQSGMVRNPNFFHSWKTAPVYLFILINRIENVCNLWTGNGKNKLPFDIVPVSFQKKTKVKSFE